MNEDRFAGLARAYDPAATEPRIYERWLRESRFQPAFDRSRPTFCITTPPPNVTGVRFPGCAGSSNGRDAGSHRAGATAMPDQAHGGYEHETPQAL